MIHTICDFCGKETDRTAIIIQMTPFRNFARYHTDAELYGGMGKTKSFVICHKCRQKHNLPDPDETYAKITDQKIQYEKTVDTYLDADFVDDKKRDSEFDG